MIRVKNLSKSYKLITCSDKDHTGFRGILSMKKKLSKEALNDITDLHL